MYTINVQMRLRSELSRYWSTFQLRLFPLLELTIGELSEQHRRFVSVVELVRVEELLSGCESKGPGRPKADRAALARAFLAKSVFDIPTTRALVERLKSDPVLHQLCCWEWSNMVPSESSFSRAFAEFANSDLPGRLHAVLLECALEDHLAGHVSRDATAISAREKPKRSVPKANDGKQPKTPTRLQRQRSMELDDMLEELPKDCNVGTKRNSKGHGHCWVGFKLHLDVIDGGIPISAALTSASVHDSQVAIPLAVMTAARVQSLYDLMDSAYDAKEIREHSRSLGHVPIIDINPRGNEELKREARAQRSIGHVTPERRRFRERSTVERVNGRLKDEFGGRYVRVRGHSKVYCHLMFGILALTVDQLMRLVL